MPKIAKKSLIIFTIVCIYFFGIRELRKSIHNFYLGTILPQEYGVINDSLSFYAQSSVSFTFCENCEDYGKGWQFKIPFGSFFLFAVLGLFLIGDTIKSFYVVAGFHFSVGVLTTLLVIFGVNYSVTFLVIMDFISRYLLPLGSFGFVAYTYGKITMKNRPYANQP